MSNGGPKKYLLGGGGGGGGLWWGSCDKLSKVRERELGRRVRGEREGGEGALTGKLRTREGRGERNE